ncbi:MAG: cupredoxin domain-containing protein [Actinomycetota bacterium]|nr:cupredoxin domain-containing protein [Actinomycetota bacterium]
MGKRSMIGISLAAALTVAACGGDESGGGSGSGGDSGDSTTLSMVDNAFDPASLTVDAGTTVDISNDGEALHNITIEGSDVDEDVDPGASTTVTVDLDPGTYTMFCEYHRAGGMEGSLTVQ